MVNFTTTQVSESGFVQTSVPEPTTIFGIGFVGVGLTATRRKSLGKQIKQKTAV
ncbi:MAG: PEP-CTERM sorting domain-containing protein [Richelia sp. SM1_7_0]|nr:PEP-CTERM sorting domain-containing protein [Richelia sp. SM2_1_7]NJM18722.1 PEP-CTERM sorting domain-containing protein [Richelia sp. SM1_7_0]